MVDPVTPQERVAILAWRLADGEALTTREIADLLGLRRRRARSLMCELSRVLAIERDGDGFWKRCSVSGANGKGLAALHAIVDPGGEGQ